MEGYRILVAPSLSWLNEASFFWITSGADAGTWFLSFETLVAGRPDTLVLSLRLE